MSKGLSLYPTKKTGADSPQNVTGTNVSGDKYAMDVAIKEGTISGTFSSSGLAGPALHSQVTVTDAGWVALPATALTDRQQLNIQNNSDYDIRVRHTNSGAYTDPAMTIISGGERFYSIQDSLVLYARAEPGAGSVTVDIEEIAT